MFRMYTVSSSPAIATFYVMLGGMLSIVWTDVVQFLIMTVAGIVIVVIGMQMVAPDMIHSFVPAGWDSPFFGWTLDIDWSSRMSLLTERMANEPYSLIRHLCHDGVAQRHLHEYGRACAQL